MPTQHDQRVQTSPLAALRRVWRISSGLAVQLDSGDKSPRHRGFNQHPLMSTLRMRRCDWRACRRSTERPCVHLCTLLFCLCLVCVYLSWNVKRSTWTAGRWQAARWANAQYRVENDPSLFSSLRKVVTLNPGLDSPLPKCPRARHWTLNFLQVEIVELFLSGILSGVH